MPGEGRKENKINYYGCMMLLGLVFFAGLHATFVGFTNDDSYFVELRGEFDSLIDLLVFRYQTDSSRVLSEAILFTLIKMPFAVWQVLDVLVCMLILHCLSGLLVDDPWSRKNFWIFLAFAAYPFMHMGSAGWICTSLNYLWPFAALLYALLVAGRRAKGKKNAPLSYAAAALAMLFAANCEMSATSLALIFALAFAYALCEKRSWGYELAGCIAGIAGVVFALLAPGRDDRTVMEVENWMPEFFDLSLLEKARLCSVFVFEHFVAIPDVVFFLFALVLALAGIRKGNPLWKNITAAVPLLTDIGFTGYYFVKDFLIGHKTTYDYSYPAIYLTEKSDKILQYAEVAGLLIFILASVVSIWCILLPQKENRTDTMAGSFLLRNKEAIWCIWLLAAGFAVRMALMLSPTMFSSWHRTLIFMYFAFLAVTIIIMFRRGLTEKKWMRHLLLAGFLAGLVVNLILTVGLQLRKAAGYY